MSQPKSRTEIVVADLRGDKQIAVLMRCSPSAVKRYRHLGETDRLPHYVDAFGNVVAYSAEVLAWMLRHGMARERVIVEPLNSPE